MLTLPVDEKGFLRSGTVRFHPSLKPLLMPIDDLRPVEWNYNNGDIEEIAYSMEINGVFGACRYREGTGEVLMGNHMWMALKGLGSEVVAGIGLLVHSDDEAYRMAVADNEIARLSRPDPGHLASLLEAIQAATPDIGLAGTGVSDRALERLHKELDEPLDLSDLSREAGWPTLSFTLPPELLAAFREMTEPAENDRMRLEALMRAAGWKDPA